MKQTFGSNEMLKVLKLTEFDLKSYCQKKKKKNMYFIVSLLAGFLVFFSGGKTEELKELCSQSEGMGNRVNNYI